MTQAFFSVDGTQILLEGTSSDGLLAASKAALEPTGKRPQPRPDVEARAAWNDRESWVSRSELWRPSWREAETFADRLLAKLPAIVQEARASASVAAG